ncbi:hypothetical protein MML48_2g00013680 [Holotrichia oblita]|uniref:Uncharacterized protein n=1 Tax=Holotrichia oblita TaxID=644536 RepID=A0ACB9TQS2_HOLOL|nr:hypothetical protein MML48_2g00013680 [Holotrichia oblita]
MDAEDNLEEFYFAAEESNENKEKDTSNEEENSENEVAHENIMVAKKKLFENEGSGSKSQTHLNISVEEISPIPKSRNLEQALQRGPQQAVEITSSPYKNYLTMKKEKSKKVSPRKPIKIRTQKKTKVNEDRWFCTICEEEDQEDMIR